MKFTNVYNLRTAGSVFSLAGASGNQSRNVPETQAGTEDAVRGDETGQSGNVARQTKFMLCIAHYDAPTTLGEVCHIRFDGSGPSATTGMLLPHDVPMIFDVTGVKTFNVNNLGASGVDIYVTALENL